MVIWALSNAIGGEIFVPKIPSYRVTDLAKAISSKHKQKVIGIRPGEKIHEMMISESDSFNTIDIGDYFVILPHDNLAIKNYYIEKYAGRQFKEGKVYDSATNSHFLSVTELKDLIATLS